MSDPHYAMGTYYFPQEVISFTLIGMAIGTWICTLVTIGICLCVNNQELQPLAYRLIATTLTSTTPLEVIVTQESQVITTTTTGTAPVEEKGAKPRSNKSLAQTKSGNTASATTPTTKEGASQRK